MPRVATFASRSHKLNGPTYGRTPPSPQLKVLCPEPGCAWSFRSPGDLERHLPQHMSPSEREKLMYRCTAPRCTFKSLQKSNLTTHFVAKHTEAKPHACPNCSFRTADPGCLNRHRRARHNYVSGAAPRKSKTQTAALIREAMARSESGSDSSASTSGSWSASSSPVSSGEFLSASSGEMLTFFSPPVSPSGLCLETMSLSPSSGSSLPASPTDSALYEDPSMFYPHPGSPSDLYPGLFPPSPSSSSGFFPSTPNNCDDQLWLPDLETCVVVGGGIEPTSAPGPALFYPAEGVDSFAFDHTTAYIPAGSFDPTQFLCDFSAPRVYESALDFAAAPSYVLQDPGSPFSGEWVDVVC
ncbi:hypothetical protein C8R47DRAFT_1313038 [Mycena vitilis]|nr:hypothetical protein C8R47DRAFT_1313038 [Mycena vitilis]